MMIVMIFYDGDDGDCDDGGCDDDDCDDGDFDDCDDGDDGDDRDGDDHGAFTSTKVSQQAGEAIDKKIPRNLQLCNRTAPGDDYYCDDDSSAL